MQRLTITHVRRWQEHRHDVGLRHVYQGRYKSFPVQGDEHFSAIFAHAGFAAPVRTDAEIEPMPLPVAGATASAYGSSLGARRPRCVGQPREPLEKGASPNAQALADIPLGFNEGDRRHHYK